MSKLTQISGKCPNYLKTLETSSSNPKCQFICSKITLIFKFHQILRNTNTTDSPQSPKAAGLTFVMTRTLDDAPGLSA